MRVTSVATGAADGALETLVDDVVRICTEAPRSGRTTPLRDVELAERLRRQPVAVQAGIWQIVLAYDATAGAAGDPPGPTPSHPFAGEPARPVERDTGLRRALEAFVKGVEERDRAVQEELDSARQRIRTTSTVAVAAGLLGILVGATTAAVAAPSGWSVAGVALAALATAMAVAMSSRATGTAQLDPWLRRGVNALPILVLLGSLAVLVLPSRSREIGATGVLVVASAALVVAAVTAVLTSGQTTAGPARAAEAPLRPADLDPGAVLSAGSAFGVELWRLQGRIGDEAARQAALAHRWLVAFVTIGGAAALTSGGAAVTASTGGPGQEWVVVLAVVGGGLGALATALNPGGRWEQTRTVAATCRSLAQELEILVRLDLATLDHSAGRAKVEEVAARFDAILGVPEHTRLWAGPSGQVTGGQVTSGRA